MFSRHILYSDMAWAVVYFIAKVIPTTCNLKISFQHHAFFVYIHHYFGANSNKYMLMQTNKLKDYLSPELVIIEIAIEQGFSISNMESFEDEKPEQDW